MAAAETDGYGFCVFEILGSPDEVAVGDVVSGDLRSHGGEKFRNETQGTDVDVYVQAFDATPLNARTLVGLRT
jgi:hypothetical protein